MVEGLALRIAEGPVPDALADLRILDVDLAGLLAGTRYRGEPVGILSARSMASVDAEHNP